MITIVFNSKIPYVAEKEPENVESEDSEESSEEDGGEGANNDSKESEIIRIKTYLQKSDSTKILCYHMVLHQNEFHIETIQSLQNEMSIDEHQT